MKNERELRKLGTESCVSVSEKSGSWGGSAVNSIKLVKSSLLQISVNKNSIKNSPFSPLIYPHIVHSTEENLSTCPENFESTNNIIIFKNLGITNRWIIRDDGMPMMAWSIINYKILQNSQDKSHLAQNTIDIKCSQYSKNVVIGLNSEQKDNVIIRKPTEIFNWGSLEWAGGNTSEFFLFWSRK